MGLQFQNVSVLADDAFHLEMNWFRNAEARPNPLRLVNTIPNDPKLDFDPVLPLLRQMVNELRAEAALPAKLL
eukprot:contig_4778_g1032